MFSVAAFVALGQPKVDDVYDVFGVFSASNQKVVWFDVSVDNPLFVDHLDSLDHLHCYVQDSLEIELSPALLEQIFQRLA